MLNRTARYLLAAIQAIIGWEWFMSGTNKVLSGTFPGGLASTLMDRMKDNPNNWYVAILQQNILPHSVFYGYLIEWTEIIIGIVLLCGSLILLGQPRTRGEPQYRLAVGFSIAVAVAAFIGAGMTVNFHFLQGGWIFPTFTSSSPYNEGIDLDALIPPISLVIIIANYAFIKALAGENPLKHFARLLSSRPLAPTNR